MTIQPQAESRANVQTAWVVALLILGPSLGLTSLALSNLGTSYVVLFVGIVLGIAAAVFLSPGKVFLLWPVVLMVYALWPAREFDPNARLVLVPVEYLPLLLVLACGSLASIIHSKKSQTKIPRYLMVLASGIVVYALLSGFWVRNRGVWLQYLVMWIIYLALCLMVARGLSQESSQTRIKFLDRLLLLLTFVLLSVFIRNLVWPSVRFGGEAFVSVFGWEGRTLDFSPIIRYRISQILTVEPFVPVAAMLYFATRKATHLVFVLTSSLAIMLSFSRTGYVALLFVLLLVLARNVFDKNIRFRGLAVRRLAVFAVLALGLAGALFVAGRALVGRVESMPVIGHVWRGELRESEFGWGRQVILQEAYRVFWESPWLGTGVGNYLEHFDTTLHVQPMTPHNLYIGYLAEFGILGSIPVMGFILYLGYFLWKAAVKASDPLVRPILWGFAAAHTMFFVMFLATDFLTTPYIWFFWGVALSFAQSAQTPDHHSFSGIEKRQPQRNGQAA